MFCQENGYEVSGELNYKGENIKDIPIEERAQKEFFNLSISFRNSWC